MPEINRVGHVVLRVSDVDAAVAFYAGKLGMEVARRSEDAAFMSFGTQHHDIGLFKVKGEATKGNLGLGHVALLINGGTDELRALHDRLVERGVEVVSTTDHGMTHSVYFNDPDGNRLEIYCDVFADPAEGLRFMRERGGRATPLDLSKVGAS